MIGATRVVNAGSVGMPFGNQSRLALARTDVQLRHTPYDLTKAAETHSRYEFSPQALDFATQNVLKLHPEAEMLEYHPR